MIDPERILKELDGLSVDHRISEPRLFAACVVGSEEDGDYDDFLTMVEGFSASYGLERRVHDGDLWYRGRKR